MLEKWFSILKCKYEDSRSREGGSVGKDVWQQLREDGTKPFVLTEPWCHTEGAPKYGSAIFQQVTVSLTARSCRSMLHGMELDVSGDSPLVIQP